MAVSRSPALFPICAFAILVGGCSTAKYQLENGHYRSHSARLDVEVRNDTVRVGPHGGPITDYPPIAVGTVPQSIRMDHPSFDVDVLTILLKYRPAEDGLQPQLQSQLGGAVYMGFGLDRYLLNYRTSPFGTPVRHMGHFGVSLGAFAGLGATPVNPWVTSFKVNEEYDGVAFASGVALIGAIDRLTLGVSLGWDQLLNSHSSVWTYQGKPWTGSVLGLNLN